MTKSPKLDPFVEQFAEVARRYCEWAEGELGEPRQEMRNARRILVELHSAALHLPDLGCGDEIDAGEVSSDECSKITHKFAKLPITGYWDVFDPLVEAAPVFNSLQDDLGDIYRDVRNGLNLYDGRHFIEAAWEWRFNFQIHWGQHLVGAQRAIHQYLADEGL